MGLGKYDRFTLVGRLFHFSRTLVSFMSDARSTKVGRTSHLSHTLVLL